MSFNQELLEILACPECQVGVTYNKDGIKETLQCIKCARIFEIKDGIPIMLPKNQE